MTVALSHKGILDRRNYGEALGKGEGLCTGIPDYLPTILYHVGGQRTVQLVEGYTPAIFS